MLNKKKIYKNTVHQNEKKRKPSLNDDTTIHPLQWYYMATNREQAPLVKTTSKVVELSLIKEQNGA